MSYYAFYTTTNMIIRADEPHLFGRQDLICPSCKCIMHYRSVSSNGHAAHFYGTDHADWCDIGVARKYSTDRYDYSMPGNSIQDIFDLVLRQGVKQPALEKSATTKQKNSSGEEHRKTIHTIRQLFAFCAFSDPRDILPDGKRVMDIYCGASTTFLYNSFVNGLHLMYAQYNGRTRDGSALFFRYPSLEDSQLAIALRAEEQSVLTDISSKLAIGDFALILAEFSHLHCDVLSTAQVVPVKKAKKIARATSKKVSQ